jgi:repressor LexA
MDTHAEKLLTFYRAHKRMPSYTEIMAFTGYKTKSAVHYFVQKLIALGVVEKDARGKLVPRRLYGEVPLLGFVEAGFPSPAEEELVDTMSFDDYLIDNREATYILRVKGDSMVNAGIVEGDMVIVERTTTPKVGQIVVAEVDGQWTMKYLRKKGSSFYLEPANDRYPPIMPKDELKVVAVVKAVVRKYHP